MPTANGDWTYVELVERETIWDQAFGLGVWYALRQLKHQDVPEPENPFRAERLQRERNRA